MSVANLETSRLASFAAAAVRSGLAPLADVAELLAAVAAANAAALDAQYGEIVEAIAASEIASHAADILAERADDCGWPPLVYNCTTNDGQGFLADDVAEVVRGLERMLDGQREAEERRMDRAEADAVAYDDVPRLRTMYRDDLARAMADAGADRVIVASFRVDESDGQTDYYGCRKAREVVIGFGRGARESFAQLRKAAAGFKPTADYGPGLSRWYAKPKTAEDYSDSNGNRVYAGTTSEWHRDLIAGPLPTRAAAEIHAAANPLQPLNMAHGPVVLLAWEITEEPIEHRENYSMGGGNYLGDSRYSGWTVSSSTYLPESAEVHSTAAYGGKAKR
jgi:hypothetical protein